MRRAFLAATAVLGFAGLAWAGYTPPPVPFGAWTTYAPTISPGSNSYTSASATGRWQQAGKAIDVQIKGTITTQGTGGGTTNLTLPVAVAADTVFFGRTATGTVVVGQVSAGASTIPLVTTTGAGFGADGTVVIVTGRYEAQ